MGELFKNILYLIISLMIFILGIRMAYLKLFKKDSWLYKESEGVDWLYDTSNINFWALILCMILGGGINSIVYIKSIILSM